MVNNNNQQKVVTIIQTIANGNDANVTEVASTETCRSPTFNTSSSSSSSPSPTGVAAFRSQLSRPLTNEEVSFPEPTFSERFMRYLVLIIYLGGLSSLGFFLSIYYIFFWDSRMPPVYKPTKKPLFPKS